MFGSFAHGFGGMQSEHERDQAKWSFSHWLLD
jgi:hypothetical protein